MGAYYAPNSEEMAIAAVSDTNPITITIRLAVSQAKRLFEIADSESINDSGFSNSDTSRASRLDAGAAGRCVRFRAVCSDWRPARFPFAIVINSLISWSTIEAASVLTSPGISTLAARPTATATKARPAIRTSVVPPARVVGIAVGTSPIWTPPNPALHTWGGGWSSPPAMRSMRSR